MEASTLEHDDSSCSCSVTCGCCGFEMSDWFMRTLAMPFCSLAYSEAWLAKLLDAPIEFVNICVSAEVKFGLLTF